MRALAGAFGAALILFAAVQMNDSDAIYWGAAYAIGAAWCFAASWRPERAARAPLNLALGVCVAASAAGVALLWPTAPGWWRREVWWENEAAREGMGAMILLAALIVAALAIHLRRRGR